MKFKNWIVLIIIYLVSIFLIIYFSLIYKNFINSVSTDSSISSVLMNVTDSNYDVLYKNILNYTQENQNFIIYVSSGFKDINLFEKNFISVVVNNHLDDSFLYIDSTVFSSFEFLGKLLIDFNYKNHVSFNHKPIFLRFNNGSIIDVIELDDFSISSIDNMLLELGVM